MWARHVPKGVTRRHIVSTWDSKILTVLLKSCSHAVVMPADAEVVGSWCLLMYAQSLSPLLPWQHNTGTPHSSVLPLVYAQEELAAEQAAHIEQANEVIAREVMARESFVREEDLARAWLRSGLQKGLNDFTKKQEHKFKQLREKVARLPATHPRKKNVTAPQVPHKWAHWLRNHRFRAWDKISNGPQVGGLAR